MSRPCKRSNAVLAPAREGGAAAFALNGSSDRTAPSAGGAPGGHERTTATVESAVPSIPAGGIAGRRALAPIPGHLEFRAARAA
jgi:hypothetical protein